uniref:PDZ domain-containing protein n=1 Tax=Scylla olivacea TaxID=85551 RepID=A0A0P4W8P3_SCYOL
MSSLPSDAPAPRLCIIVKWPYFEGYGFNLHAEKSKPGQYIGKVDENSPAEKAGLLEDDRIIEVNGVNIANENHKQVVQRIKAVPNETRLLVVDPAADRYYKNRNIVVRGSQDNVITRSSVLEEKAPPTPETQTVSPPTSVSNGHHEEIDNRSVSSAASSSAASEASTQPQHAAALAEADKDSTVEEVASNETMEKEKSRSPSPQPAEEAENPSEEILIPEEDAASLSGSDKVSENDVIAPVEESLPEPSETEVPQIEVSLEGQEQTLPEADASQEEEVHQQTEEKEEEEEDDDEKELGIKGEEDEQEDVLW